MNEPFEARNKTACRGGATENAGVENAIRSKMQGWNTQEWKSREQIAGLENAGVEKSGVDRRGGKCRSGKVGSKSQGWKMQELGMGSRTAIIQRDSLKLLPENCL